MGRRSKRIHISGGTRALSDGRGRGKEKEAARYRAGIYARLSSDQNQKNESIGVQIGMAEKYVEDWNRHHEDKIEIVERYADLGKTGINFDRHAFKQLMQDIRLGDINCVIVKDLSRFGRNYLETGNYLEKIFPFLGVRFIAVSDAYDTGAEGNHTRQMAAEIKNLVNDMYARDASVKTKLSLKQRREEGSYVGGRPPYGYEIYRDGRIRKLRPDENTAEIVRTVYRKFVETESYKAVADYLNMRRINPPAVYGKNKEVYCPEGTVYKGWEIGSVERILKSETYLGTLVQGRSSITARNEAARIRKPETEWIRKENTHEALIERCLYGQAEEICLRIQERIHNYEHKAEGCPVGENIFDRVLYCGVCGRKMTRSSHIIQGADGRRERKDGYFCMDSIRTKKEYCTQPNRISGTELSDILCVLLRTGFTVQLKKKKDYIKQGQALIRQKLLELERRLRRTEQAVRTLSEEEGITYAAYRTGRLTQEEYMRYRIDKEVRWRDLEMQKRRYQNEIKSLGRNGERCLKAVRSLVRLKKKEELTKELVETLIEKIFVYPGKRIEVVFAYGSGFTRRTE